jgi:twitching motility protein PilT
VYDRSLTVKTIEEMIRYLARDDVAEFAVVSDRLPCVKVGSAFQPVDDVAPNTDQILEMLVSVGGSRYVDSLGPKPVQWTTRLEGVGAVSVSALMRDDIVQARFMLGRPAAREAQGSSPAVTAPRSDRDGTLRDQRPAFDAREARPDIDPSARGRVLSAPPAPAAAAALVANEPQFDLEDRANITARPMSGSVAVARELQLDDARDSSPLELAASVRPEPRAPRAPVPAAAPAPVPAAAHAVASLPPARNGPRAAAPWFDELVAHARSLNASDLHVLPGRPPLLRIAGDLLPMDSAELDVARVENAVDHILPDRLRPMLDVDGSCDFAITEALGRSRVNISRQRTGPKICVRLIPNAVPTLESLGLPAQIENATHHHQGLILVTGPTGHGKTSTLAAIVDIINTHTTHHVITVEDPVEYVHPRKRAMMSQREVGTHTRTFASALKASLREDPDVIVVGELRDTETVRMALSASETGHLVLGTMNTQSAAKTIDRLIDLFPPGDQAQVRLALAGGLRLIVSQRLLPNADRTGQVAAAELLPGSISLWSLIRDNKTFQIPSLQQRGKGIGIIRFDDSLVELVKSGRTSLEIAKEYAENAEDVELTVLGKKPVAVNPMAPKAAGEGIFGKAGNLFRGSGKGG